MGDLHIFVVNFVINLHVYLWLFLWLIYMFISAKSEALKQFLPQNVRDFQQYQSCNRAP